MDLQANVCTRITARRVRRPGSHAGGRVRSSRGDPAKPQESTRDPTVSEKHRDADRKASVRKGRCLLFSPHISAADAEESVTLSHSAEDVMNTAIITPAPVYSEFDRMVDRELCKTYFRGWITGFPDEGGHPVVDGIRFEDFEAAADRLHDHTI
jgi:hypothetical protein